MFYMIKSNTHQPGLVGSLLASIYYKNNINLLNFRRMKSVNKP